MKDTPLGTEKTPTESESVALVADLRCWDGRFNLQLLTVGTQRGKRSKTQKKELLFI